MTSLLWTNALLAQALPDSTASLSIQLTSGDTLQLPHTNLVPFSLQLLQGGTALDTSLYYIDYFAGRLAAKNRLLTGVPLQLRYRYFLDQELAKPKAAYVVEADSASRDSLTASERIEQRLRQTTLPTSPQDSNRFRLETELNRSGSLTRGITIGSNRDLAVNSDFRLQLDGKLSEDLGIEAAITDQNIPIQPSGTTQQLSDFDRIFVRLKRERQQLTFGDLELRHDSSRFVSYYRDVQGLALGVLSKDSLTSFELAGASSKGRFQTNTFVGENGRQGPYRLTGAEGERFIIVLAGSERVYINGQLMARGENRDYVVDYNTGELTFTALRPIDANTRIVVDFEYAVRNYARSFISGGLQTEALNGRLQVGIHYVREADNPNAPVDLNLTAADELALSEVPGDSSRALLPGADSVGYSSDEVRYAQIDTLVGGTLYQGVFRRSTDPINAVWRVNFTFVGAGQGDYVRESETVNASVFRWVAPDGAGRPQGDYVVGRLVPLPQSIEVAELQASYSLGEHTAIYTETAVSRQRNNRYTADEGTLGVASRLGFSARGAQVGTAKLTADVGLQYVDERYSNLDRVFAKEYGRLWNYNDLQARATERLAEGRASLRWPGGVQLGAGGGYRTFGGSLTTSRAEASAASQDSSLLLGSLQFEWLQTTNDSLASTSEWTRLQGDVSRLFGYRSGLPDSLAQKGWQLGTEVWLERRQDDEADSLSILGRGSFAFADVTPYLQTWGQRKLQVRLALGYRYEQAFIAGELRNKARTLRPVVSIGYQPTPRSQLQLTASYLDFDLLDDAFGSLGLTDQQRLLGRLAARHRTTNNALQVNGFYEVSAEQVARRQLVFLEVLPGQGQYEWRDYNEDGIQDLNEFELSVNPLTANYIQIFAPTNELEPAIRLTTGGSLNWDLRPALEEDERWPASWLKVLSGRTVVRIDQQRRDPADALSSYVVDLRNFDAPDTNLFSGLLTVRQELTLFRGSPEGEMGFSYLQSRNLNRLASGLDQNRLELVRADQRLNLNGGSTLANIVLWQRKRSLSENLVGRTFDIRTWAVTPSYVQPINRKQSLELNYTLRYRENQAETGERLQSLRGHQVVVEWRWRYAKQSNLTARGTWLLNELQGEAVGGSVGYELLDGLQAGRNGLLGLQWTQRLNKLLELNVVYDGRFSEPVAPIHAARLQVRALF